MTVLNDEIVELPASALAQLVLQGKVSARQVTRSFVDRCEKTDEQLNVFAYRDFDAAIKQAHFVDRLIAEGRYPGPLAGVPVSVKDLISVQGVPFALGSRLFAGEIAKHDAPSVARLRNAGACILGKTTTSELGSKAVGHSPLTGHTLNPWNRVLTAGGSSAGAAAGVATRMFPVALGTDGGGSSRIPASFCGVVGYKPTFGRIPVWPPSATPTLAHVGILGNAVDDIQLLLAVVQGYDRRDPFSYPVGSTAQLYEMRSPIELSVGWCNAINDQRADPDVEAIAYEWLEKSVGSGIESFEFGTEISFRDLWNAEFYGGIKSRLGQLSDSPDLDPSLTLALRALSPDADQVRRFGRDRLLAYAVIDAIFDRFDLLCTPCTPTVAPPAGSDQPPGMEHFGAVDWSYFTYPFNLSGHPAVSVPVGLSEHGLPVGLQIVGRKHDDAKVLAFARFVEAQVRFSARYRTPSIQSFRNNGFA
ncbi:amidase [Paraburkholderia sediminicola]|uniref:amidase n=1 Tax=Paraburkholderia sediminicola TaxID=458836 RepID=UPI0038B6EB91